MIHVYDMIARTVAQEQTQACFALMGDANMNFAIGVSPLRIFRYVENTDRHQFMFKNIFKALIW